MKRIIIILATLSLCWGCQKEPSVTREGSPVDIAVAASRVAEIVSATESRGTLILMFYKAVELGKDNGLYQDHIGAMNCVSIPLGDISSRSDDDSSITISFTDGRSAKFTIYKGELSIQLSSETIVLTKDSQSGSVSINAARNSEEEFVCTVLSFGSGTSCEVSPSGDGYVLTVTKTREGNHDSAVVLVCSNGFASQTVSVNVHEDWFSFPDGKTSVSASCPEAASSFVTALDTNMPYEIILPEGCGWISVTDKGANSLNLSVSENEGHETRAASVVLRSTLGDLTISVTQEGKPIPPAWYEDRDILMKLFTQCGGENWTRKTNWGSSLPLKYWENVHTDEDGRVTFLNLCDNGLTGPLPDELWSLPRIEELFLDHNNISGSIPHSVGNAISLKTLKLGNCNFVEKIPKEIGLLVNLESLSLGNTDTIISVSVGESADVGGSRKCEFFNSFEGALPESVKNLTKLKYLYLIKCGLSGDVPLDEAVVKIYR